MMPDSELAAVVILVFLGLIIALLAIFYRMKYNSRKEVQTPWDWMFEQTRIQQKKNTKFAALRKRQEIQEIWGNKQNPGRRMTSEELSEAKRTRIYNLPEKVAKWRRLEAETEAKRTRIYNLPENVERRRLEAEEERIRRYNLPINVERRRLADVERRRKEEEAEKRKREKKLKCSYCNSGTNYVCDVPNGCKNGICKKCRESGKAKANYTKTVFKKGWITNQVGFNRKGYQCNKCANPPVYDDGSDVGY